MQSIYRFWKKDWINKLIIGVGVLILLGVSVDLILLLKPKPSGGSLLKEIFPTATLPLQVIMAQQVATAEYAAAMATASVPPTMTTRPFTPLALTPTPAQTLTPELLTATPAALLTALPPQGTPSPVPTLSAAAGLACITGDRPQTGKVVDVIDGNTIKVLIDGLVYQVRYLGVQTPAEGNFAPAASAINSRMTLFKDATLFKDSQDADPVGRLLRYVKVEDTFVNLELIQQGLATVADQPADFSCRQVFKAAEQAAVAAQIGIWKITPAPSEP
jgi:endonuclease YncB( thermonuclease family)